MLLFYKILRIIRNSIFIFLICLAIYYTIIYPFIHLPGTKEQKAYKFSFSSIVTDINKKPIFIFHNNELRIYSDFHDIPEWVYNFLFSEDFINAFPIFKKYNFYNKTIQDYYKNYILKKLYPDNTGFIFNFQLSKLKKKYYLIITILNIYFVILLNLTETFMVFLLCPLFILIKN